MNRYVKNEGIDLVYELGENTYYSPSTDSIHLRLKEQFTSEYNYLSVLSHEICHSTGADKRLKREFGEPFSERYAMEELRAEIGAAFVANDLELNIDEKSINNHKSYIQSWLDVIKEKPTELFKTINEVQDICDYVMEKGERELFKNISKENKISKPKGIKEMMKEAKDIKKNKRMILKSLLNINKYINRV